MRRSIGTSLLGAAALLAGTGCGDGGPTLDPSTLVAKDLGSVALDIKGLSDEVAVDAPPGAESLTLVGAEADAGELLFRVGDPTGHLLTSDQDRCAALTGELRTYPEAALSVAMLPNDDHHGLPEGTYTVRVRAYATPTSCGAPPMPALGPVALRALWKTVPVGATGAHAPLRGQRLAVNVFILGGVARTRLLTPALDRLRDLYRRAGIEVGSPTIVEVPDPDGRFARVDLDATDSELRAAMRAIPAGDGVNLVFVKEITAGPGFIIFGVAAGIPGVPGRGSERAGVLLSEVILDPAMYDATFAGNVMAHETGHFLGLFHSTEADGTSDPIDDTPSCPRFKDVNGNGLDRTECLDYDGNNLMFWEGESFTGKETSAYGALTPGQQHVILRSAATR